MPGGEGPSSKCWLIVIIMSYSQDRCEAQMGHGMQRHAADTTRQRWRYSVNGPLPLRGNLKFMLFVFTPSGRGGEPGRSLTPRCSRGSAPCPEVGWRQRRGPGPGSPARGSSHDFLSRSPRGYVCAYVLHHMHNCIREYVLTCHLFFIFHASELLWGQHVGLPPGQSGRAGRKLAVFCH